MEKNFKKFLAGYQRFRRRYAQGDQSVMRSLAQSGQKPHVMVVACCDSRVDPALILQCDPGDLFVVRNVANIIPPYEQDGAHHGTSAALEFGIRSLKIQHLIVLGHSQCGGIQALLSDSHGYQDDFITNWVAIVSLPNGNAQRVDAAAKLALQRSYKNCFTFPWIAERVKRKRLTVQLWFFDIKRGEISVYSPENGRYQPLGAEESPVFCTNTLIDKG